ncbi:MAG TPA: type II toxin-antitoxin system HicA family toxin [Candidatus Atribacteria bacterium]|nr:type II toxin-antitoxin system HicA family toxin [Candidatus Atribacteria bacterium]
MLSRIKKSYHTYIHPKLKKRFIVPLHKKDLPKGTFYTILKQAGISRKDLNDL